MKSKKQQGIRIHLEGLAEATDALLNGEYKNVNGVGVPMDLKRKDDYWKIKDQQLIISYEHKGYKYTVEIRRAL